MRSSVSSQSASDTLFGLVFEKGDRKPPCLWEEILAFTSPGSGTVQLCVHHFARAARNDAGIAAAKLIHEQLHTLGLGENPPHAPGDHPPRAGVLRGLRVSPP